MNKKEYIYKDLKKKIIESKITIHDVLKEENIASKYKVSRTPAREALQLLEKDGFLKKIRKVGYVIKPLSINDLKEIIGLRSLLESYAAYLSTLNYNEKTVKRLKELNEKANNAIENRNLERFFKINSEFHQSLYKASNNSRLSFLIDHLNENLIRYRLMLLKISKLPKISYFDHCDMINAMEEKNPEKVREIVKQHILKGGEELIKYIESGKLEIIV